MNMEQVYLRAFVALALILNIDCDLMYQCQAPGSKCLGSSPCCSEENWCGSGPLHCAGGCLVSKSTGCFTKMPCVNQTIDFRSLSFDNLVPVSRLRNTMFGDRFAVITGDSDVTEEKGLDLKLKYTGINDEGRKYGMGTRVASVFYVDYGTVTVKMKVAHGSGVVTGFIFMADEKDEIDFEILGKDTYTIETNYYYDGILDYTKGRKHRVNNDLSTDYFEYTINWSFNSIEWKFQNETLRVLKRNSSSDAYPSRKARIQLSIWDGGSMAKGTREWAGETNWENVKAYESFVESIAIRCESNQPNVETSKAQQTKEIHKQILLIIILLIINKTII